MFSLNLASLCQSSARMIALLAIAVVFIMFTAANSPLFAGSHSKAVIVPRHDYRFAVAAGKEWTIGRCKHNKNDSYRQQSNHSGRALT